MLRRLLPTALLVALPVALSAQRMPDGSAVVRPPSHDATPTPAAAVAGRLAPVCDGSEVRRLERRRTIGGAIAVAALASDVVAFALSRAPANPAGAPLAIARGRRAMSFSLATLPIVLAGAAVHGSAYPGDEFWQRTLARMRVGETRSADVRACLRAPAAVSWTTSEERLTYFTTPPDTWRLQRSIGAVTFTFRDSVLTEVRRSEARLPPGALQPVIAPLPPT